jgi:hypothetical protein
MFRTYTSKLRNVVSILRMPKQNFDEPNPSFEKAYPYFDEFYPAG